MLVHMNIHQTTNQKSVFYVIQPCPNFRSKDNKCWKPFSREVIALITTSTNGFLALPSLESPSCDLISQSENLEQQVKRLASEWRRMQLQLEAPVGHQVNLNVSWDDKLCDLLGPLIDQFEQKQRDKCEDHRMTGSIPFDFVGSAIRAHVPDGYTFKAFPIQVCLLFFILLVYINDKLFLIF